MLNITDILIRLVRTIYTTIYTTVAILYNILARIWPFVLILELALGLVFITAIVSSYNEGRNIEENMTYIEYTEFLKMLSNKQIAKVVLVAPNKVSFTTIDSLQYTTSIIGSLDLLVDKAQVNDVKIEYARPEDNIPDMLLSGFFNFIGLIFNVIAQLAVVYFVYTLILRSATPAEAMSEPGLDGNKVRITLDDVIGLSEAKESMYDLIEFIKHREIYKENNIDFPKGAMLIGPPGVGKTHLAKGLAGSLDLPFLALDAGSVNGIIVGQGAEKISSVFRKARSLAAEHGGCILFIDEVDAIAMQRRQYGMSSEDSTYTLNTLLAEIDGFGSKNDGLFVLCATNIDIDRIERALIRPGRIEQIIAIQYPSLRDRKDLIEYYARFYGLNVDEDLALSVARNARGTGSSVKSAMSLLARTLIKSDSLDKRVEFDDIWDAIMESAMGKVKKDDSYLLSPEEKRDVDTLTAYHELGHAFCTIKPNDSSSTLYVSEVSIIRRGSTGGHTMMIDLCNSNQLHYYIDQLEDDITIYLGGVAAEDVLMKRRTLGATHDLFAARNKIDHVLSTGLYSNNFVSVNLRSSETRKYIEAERERILKRCYRRARKIVEENEDAIRSISEKLIEERRIIGENFYNLLEENGYLVERSKDSTKVSKEV